MNLSKLTPWFVGATLLVLLAGVAGWAIGSGDANGRSDSNRARETGYAAGYRVLFSQARAVTAARGFKAGSVRGAKAGAKAGSGEGARIGGGNAEIEQAVAAEKAAESAASAAESEITARQANCGALPAAPSWCPTSDELAAYREAVRAAREAAEQAEKEEQKQKQGSGDGPR